MRTYELLVIEDNQGDIGLLHEAFESAGLTYKMTAFADGELALNYVRQRGNTPGEAQPDLVMLDLNLPKVEGVTILEAIRNSPYMASAPVIVMSSSSSPRDRERVMAFPSVQMIVKPADLEEFLQIGDTVRGVLQQNASRAAE